MTWWDQVNDETTTDEAVMPPSSPTSPRPGRARKLKLATSVVVVLAAVGIGTIIGHEAWTSGSTTVAASSSPTTSSGGFGNGFGGFGNFPGFSGSGFGSGSSSSSGSSGSSSGTKSDPHAASIAKSVDVGLVDINTTLSYEAESAAGTGMIISRGGLVLTNNHVIDGATSITARDVATGKTYQVKVLGYDTTKDVALLQLEGAKNLQTVSLGNSKSVKVGDTIVGIGNAEGAGGTPSYASGSVVALNQSITAEDSDSATDAESLTNMIEINANIEPGDSGGPLVNSSGDVVGMDTAGSASSGGFGFYGGTSTTAQAYAIPINVAMDIAKAIAKGDGSSTIHIGTTAFIGVGIGTSQSGFNGSSTSTTGAVVEEILAGGPASSTALAVGDTITSINGQTVSSPTDLQTILSTLKPGDTITVGYTTESGTSATLSLTLGSGPPQ